MTRATRATRSKAFKEDKPYASVQRIGRLMYSVLVKDGATSTAEPWKVFGYHRAVRKAKKELKKYLVRKGLRGQVERIDS